MCLSELFWAAALVLTKTVEIPLLGADDFCAHGRTWQQADCLCSRTYVMAPSRRGAGSWGPLLCLHEATLKRPTHGLS